jgi:hypothetical protein
VLAAARAQSRNQRRAGRRSRQPRIDGRRRATSVGRPRWFPRADVPALHLGGGRSEPKAIFPIWCGKPADGTGFFNAPGFEIVDVPEEKKIYILDIAGPHSWRVIYMDGRPHPPVDELRPTYLGHSIGRWDGDTLAIDSVGFNEKQWVAGSYPTSDQLHMTERISRPNLKTLSYEMTIDDPGVYTRPWSGRWTITEATPSKWIAGGEMFEYICQDSR